MRISDWSSDVCSSDLLGRDHQFVAVRGEIGREDAAEILLRRAVWRAVIVGEIDMRDAAIERAAQHRAAGFEHVRAAEILPRSEERRVGKGWFSQCKSWWSPYQ